ncbi:hypothetical protein Gotri_006309 [Gossypium trilobum]|uniref:Uncharacterized protein n=1 Tax=Gossypium trilobum TaxID=34281 RepID=A0A7J9EZG1_9ROSI|nr:hypothetical protein [Gossypium trilobum]
MGHGVKECTSISIAKREKADDGYSYSLALKAESNLIGEQIGSEKGVEVLVIADEQQKFRNQEDSLSMQIKDPCQSISDFFPDQSYPDNDVAINKTFDSLAHIFELKSTIQKELSPYIC